MNYSGYELGKTYLDHYSGKQHTITALHAPTDKHGWYVTSTWQDGHSTVHCTDLDKRDKVLTSP